MKKTVWKGGALLAPVPAVMVSCGTIEKPNVMTVAWTGILNTNPPKTYISLRKSRYSYDIIKESGEFVINLTNHELIRACDFCGVRSGRDVDKFEKCDLTAQAATVVNAPMIGQSPVSIECKVSEIVELGSHDMFIADILAVNVDETLIDSTGRLCLERAGLTAYVHGDYFALGKKIGQFGFSVQKKRAPKNKPVSQKTAPSKPIIVDNTLSQQADEKASEMPKSHRDVQTKSATHGNGADRSRVQSGKSSYNKSGKSTFDYNHSNKDRNNENNHNGNYKHNNYGNNSNNVQSRDDSKAKNNKSSDMPHNNREYKSGNRNSQKNNGKKKF